jgi:MarR family transcriptional regulator, organic hydroperoxide resistance regulator
VFDLRNYLPYLLNRVGFAVSDAFAGSLAEASLTVPSWRVLAVLMTEGTVRIGELAELTSIEISTLSRLISGLQRRGLVARKSAKNDARVVNVALTARGRAVVTRLVPDAVELEERLVAGMPAGEIAELKRLLVKLYVNITDQGAESSAHRRSA